MWYALEYCSAVKRNRRPTPKTSWINPKGFVLRAKVNVWKVIYCISFLFLLWQIYHKFSGLNNTNLFILQFWKWRIKNPSLKPQKGETWAVLVPPGDSVGRPISLASAALSGRLHRLAWPLPGAPHPPPPALHLLLPLLWSLTSSFPRFLWFHWAHADNPG